MYITKRLNVTKNKYQRVACISLGAAILNAFLSPEVTLIGSGAGNYAVAAIPLLLAFPVGLISAGISKKWSLESVFFGAISTTFLLIIAISWIEVLNVKLDDDVPKFEEIVIASKFKAGKSSKPHRIVFRLPHSVSMGEIPLSREMLETIQVGDSLLLQIGRGYFGMPWIKGLPMKAAKQVTSLR